MVICAVSDTHEMHDDLIVQPGDLFIHAGDILFGQNSRALSVLRDFDEWLGKIPYRHKVLVPGNHDRVLVEPRNRGLLKNATLLLNSGMTIEGVRIWGSPITPLPGVAFGMPDASERRKLWASIPKDTDILVTHCPPYGIRDQEADSDVHQGCPELRKAVVRLRPRLHVFGHIHNGYGITPTKDILFINAALYDGGELGKRPIVLNLKARGERSR